MAIRVLANGDTILVSGALGVATSATASTNASGIVTFSGPGNSQIKATVYRAAGYPLAVTSADPYYRIGILRDAADSSRCCVISDDPYFQRVISGTGTPWTATTGPWSTTLTLGDWYGAKLSLDSVSLAGSYCDVVLKWDTDLDGTISGTLGAAYPYASLAWDSGLATYTDSGKQLGRYKTDAAGRLWEWMPDDTSQPIILPRGHGAIGYRTGLTPWPGATAPEVVLDSARVAYLQEDKALTPNASVLLDIAAVKIKATGPSGALVYCYWEEGTDRGSINLATGAGSAIGMPPGTYTLACYSNANNYILRQTLNCPSAGTYSATFGAMTNVPVGSYGGCVYQYGASGLGGATIYTRRIAIPPFGWSQLTSTASNGTFGPIALPAGAGSLAVEHSTWGAAMTYGSNRAFDPVLSARGAIIASKRTIPVSEGLYLWGPRGDHDNLIPATSLAYITNTKTGTKYDFISTTSGKGIKTDLMPRWHFSGAIGTKPAAKYIYKLWRANGVSTATTFGVGDDTYPGWANLPFNTASSKGALFTESMGGKVWGNAVEFTYDDNDGDMPEADRFNLEFGGLPPLYLRLRPNWNDASGAGTGVRAVQTFTALECPYCQGPVSTEPGEALADRGYCRNCGNAWSDTDAMDARTYFASPTIKSGSKSIRLVNQDRTETATAKALDYWWAPDDYQEDSTYVTQSGRGQATNAPRWFAQHIHFGTFSGGAWTGNETISAVAASQGRSIGPGRVKAIFPAGYTYGGAGVTLKATLERGDGATETQVFAVNTGDGRGAGDAWGTYIPINRVRPMHALEDLGAWDRNIGLYLKVTNCEVVGGVSGNVQFSLVNAAPHLRKTAGISVADEAASPVALEWGTVLQRNPDLWHGPWKRTYLVYRGDTNIIQLTKSDDGGTTWTATQQVTGAGFDFPAIEKRITGELIVNATKGGAPSVVKTFVSKDDGATWTSNARSFAGTRMDVQPHLGSKQLGAITSGSVKYLNGLSAWSTIHGRTSGNAAATTLQQYTTVTADASNERAAVIRKPNGRIVAAIENAAGNIEMHQSDYNGLTWTSAAASFGWGKPDLAQGTNGVEYLAGTDGTDHLVRRGLNGMSTSYAWNSTLAAGGSTVKTSAVMVEDVDAERPALVKLNSWGRPLVVAATKQGQVEIHESRDDGLSWNRLA